MRRSTYAPRRMRARRTQRSIEQDKSRRRRATTFGLAADRVCRSSLSGQPRATFLKQRGVGAHDGLRTWKDRQCSPALCSQERSSARVAQRFHAVPEVAHRKLDLKACAQRHAKRCEHRWFEQFGAPQACVVTGHDASVVFSAVWRVTDGPLDQLCAVRGDEAGDSGSPRPPQRHESAQGESRSREHEPPHWDQPLGAPGFPPPPAARFSSRRLASSRGEGERRLAMDRERRGDGGVRCRGGLGIALGAPRHWRGSANAFTQVQNSSPENRFWRVAHSDTRKGVRSGALKPPTAREVRQRDASSSCAE